jgi:hypothetical protein
MVYLGSRVAITLGSFVGLTIIVIFADSIYRGGLCGMDFIHHLCEPLVNSATDFDPLPLVHRATIFVCKLIVSQCAS